MSLGGLHLQQNWTGAPSQLLDQQLHNFAPHQQLIFSTQLQEQAISKIQQDFLLLQNQHVLGAQNHLSQLTFQQQQIIAAPRTSDRSSRSSCGDDLLRGSSEGSSAKAERIAGACSYMAGRRRREVAVAPTIYDHERASCSQPGCSSTPCITDMLWPGAAAQASAGGGFSMQGPPPAPSTTDTGAQLQKFGAGTGWQYRFFRSNSD